MTETTSTASPAVARNENRLPGKALFGLFLAGFIGILTECLPAGLLPEISATLHTNVSLTGQVVTIYALATAVAAIPLSRLTAKWPRKNVLQFALGVVAVAVAVTNALTALSTDYPLTMVIWFVAGTGTALIWPLLGGYGDRRTKTCFSSRGLNQALRPTRWNGRLNWRYGSRLLASSSTSAIAATCAGSSRLTSAPLKSSQSVNSHTPYQRTGSTPPLRSSSLNCSTVWARVGTPSTPTSSVVSNAARASAHRRSRAGRTAIVLALPDMIETMPPWTARRHSSSTSGSGLSR